MCCWVLHSPCTFLAVVFECNVYPRVFCFVFVCSVVVVVVSSLFALLHWKFLASTKSKTKKNEPERWHLSNSCIPTFTAIFYTHTHTHTSLCVCVCVCVCPRLSIFRLLFPHEAFVKEKNKQKKQILQICNSKKKTERICVSCWHPKTPPTHTHTPPRPLFLFFSFFFFFGLRLERSYVKFVSMK